MVTFNTYRNNIKPMLLGIPFVVVIFLCLLWAIMTLEIACFRHFSRLHSITYGIMSVVSIGMIIAIPFLGRFMLNCFSIPCLTLSVFFGLPIFLVGFFMSCFAFCALVISFVNSLAFCCFSICSVTQFAVFRMAVFFGPVLVKFRKRLVFFAVRTRFCYKWFSHNQFLTNWLCFEPLQTRYLCGSAYNIGNYLSCQYKNRKN